MHDEGGAVSGTAHRTAAAKQPNRRERTARVVEGEAVGEAATFAAAGVQTLRYVLTRELPSDVGINQARQLLDRARGLLDVPSLPDRRVA